jgi:hypothetical protein
VAPRVNARIPVRIKKEKKVIEGRTKNISSTGAYCVADRFIPLNTELDVSLLIPKMAGKGHRGLKRLKCHGIVVRNQPEQVREKATRYGLAIHFTGIGPGDKQELSSYVEKRLPPEMRKTLALHRMKSPAYDPGRIFSTERLGGKGFSVRSSNFRIIDEGISLSKNGICCRTDRNIPLFREIAVNLLLPPTAERYREAEALQCSAIVVGCTRVQETGRYDMAAYFVGLSKEQKDRLDECIKRIM